MPFSKNLIDAINNYCKKDLPNDDFYDNLFKFINDDIIRNKIILEYKNTRYFYKIFEGLQVNKEKLLIETKLQIIMYASIHEAIVTYVLLKLFRKTPEVQDLLKIKVLTKYSIPKKSLEKLQNELTHDGKEIVPCFYNEKKVDETKIRYDDKVNTLFKLRLISSQMKNDLIDIYEYRNTIHLEADLKKNLDYTIEKSRNAYRRVEGLNIELNQSIMNGILF